MPRLQGFILSQCLLACVCLMLAPSFAGACNIPVFRYALERWQSDLIELVVFHDAALTEQQNRIFAGLEKESRNHGGIANLQVITRQIDDITDEDLKTVWKKLSDETKSSLPLLVARSRVGRGQWLNVWTGPLTKVNEIGLLDSPVRQELSNRLLEGDSVVWLVLKSSDKELTESTIQMLASTLPDVAKQIPIPEGIGLPGSELFSAIPLDIHFSVLTVDPSDPQESFLVNWLKQHSPTAFAEGSPLIVPVFGRGRSLEVLTADILSPTLVKELSIFLCSACSCQVKELNPGFDLLIKTNWEFELYGEEPPEIPSTASASEKNFDEPILLPIPRGSDHEESSQNNELNKVSIRPGSVIDQPNEPLPPLGSHRLSWLLLMFLSIVVLVAAVAGIKKKPYDP